MSDKSPTPGVPPARAVVDRMTGYVPGEQPRPGEKVVKLNTNENPFPPSPRVIDAIGAVDPDRLRRYPNPVASDFLSVAARLHGVRPDMIIAGNGSDEILAIALRAYLDADDTLAFPDPTYSLYPVLAEIGDHRVVRVPWAADWQLPVDALARSGAKAIFFANPNAPSGTPVPQAQARALCRAFDGVVLIDEAYVDFAEESSLPLLADCPNAVIVRTLSKGYALAGLRFGYAIAAPAIIAAMNKVKDSYNCDAISITAACAALDDQAHARQSWDHVRSERARVTDELTRCGFSVLPSQANFILATVPGGDAAALYGKLKSRGVLVRHFALPGLQDKLRITIGTRADNDALLGAL